MTCPECGTEMIPSARFCHRCGWDTRLAAAGSASSGAHERPSWKRWSMAAVLGFGLLLVLWLLVIPRSDASATLLVGQKAPDFDLESLDGGRIRLAGLAGRPVILNFWATWCTPCRKEMPEFQRMADQYGSQGLEVIGINVGESRVGAGAFVRQLDLRFPILLDLKETAQNAYKILPLPATFFVDRTGTIRAIYQYQMSPAQIEAEVQRLLVRE